MGRIFAQTVAIPSSYTPKYHLRHVKYSRPSAQGFDNRSKARLQGFPWHQKFHIRKLSSFRVVDHVVRCQHSREWPGATEIGHENKLQLAVKQYKPKGHTTPGREDVTIIAAHANGFPKEIYEPLWDDLYERLKLTGRQIRSIWIADLAHQGQSGVLNEGSLGNDPCWFDHARDLLFLINEKQDQMPQPLIGIGHSVGATQLAHLSLIHPSLLQGLILIDPVIQLENVGKVYGLASTYRRDIWPSREEAAERFRNTKFFQAWDPRVLDKWIEFGLRPLPTEIYPDPTTPPPSPPLATSSPSSNAAVTLTTPKSQEVFTFLRPVYSNNQEDIPNLDDIEPDYPFYRPEAPHIFRRLPELKPSVLYIFGSKSDLNPPQARHDKVSTTGIGHSRPKEASSIQKRNVHEVVLDAGHLVPMERVTETAEAAASFVDNTIIQWSKKRRRHEERWFSRGSRIERISIDDVWREKIGPKGGGNIKS